MGFQDYVARIASWLWTNLSLTACLAVWGAGLSTYLALRDRSRVKVKLDHFRESDPQVLPRFQGYYLRITATNHGQRVVTITRAGIRLADGRDFTTVILPAGQDLPKRLEEGDYLYLDVQVNEIPEGALFVWVKDSKGKKYKAPSEPLKQVLDLHGKEALEALDRIMAQAPRE